jgi:hypothetical protein
MAVGGSGAYDPRVIADGGGVPGPTQAQRETISKAGAVVAADDRIVAAWLVGSFAAGTADAFSDIDLHCAITDESAGWFAEHWTGIARQITPLVLAGPVPGVLGGYVITPEWLHLDLVFHQQSQCDASALTSVRPLFDRTGALLPAERIPVADTPRDPYFPADAYFPAEAVNLYFYLLGNLAVVLGRGEVLLAMNGAIMRRDVGLVPVMLAENGVRKHDGRKRLNRYLTASQVAFLESLPPLSASPDSVITFDKLVAADLIKRGRKLAEQTGSRWPADLEEATASYLERCLNVSFGT